MHQEAKRFARDDFDILLIGHGGTRRSRAPPVRRRRTSSSSTAPDDVANVQVRDPEKVVWLSQTTLSVDETLATVDQLKNRFPGLQSPPSDDICYATQNRQQAVKQMAGECDLVLVVGSTNSSNSVRLVEVALEAGARGVAPGRLRLRDRPAWLEGVGTVGVTSGASVPEILVSEVLDWLAERGLPRRRDGQGRRGAAGLRAARTSSAAPRRPRRRRTPSSWL